jgi:tol-pal system protein YbgF
MNVRTNVLAMVVIGALTGCAAHADFVQVRDQIHTVSKQQDQVRRQQEELAVRLQSIEAKLSSATEQAEHAAKESDVRSRIDDVISRLQELETRLAKQSPSSTFSGGAPSAGNGSRQSKPAKVPDPIPTLPGTPDMTPTSAYNLAHNDYLDGRYELAIEGFRRFLKDFPKSSLAANAHYWIGQSYYRLKDHTQAIQEFDKVLADYPRSEKVPPALFYLGLSWSAAGDTAKAKTYFKRVIDEFPPSDEAKLAKTKLAEIR